MGNKKGKKKHGGSSRDGRRARRGSRPSPLPAAREYERAVARVVLCALVDLEARLGSPPPRRLLINYLRGNQLPPGEDPGAEGGEAGSFGVLAHAARGWIEDLADRLLEEGYLELAGGGATRRALSGAGRRLLAGGEMPPRGLLPAPPLLGRNPLVEKALRDLRRRLAGEAGRPAYGVFTNETLARLAAAPPRSLADLAGVPGLGAERVRRFGRRILAALRAAERAQGTDGACPGGP